MAGPMSYPNSSDKQPLSADNAVDRIQGYLFLANRVPLQKIVFLD